MYIYIHVYMYIFIFFWNGDRYYYYCHYTIVITIFLDMGIYPLVEPRKLQIGTKMRFSAMKVGEKTRVTCNRRHKKCWENPVSCSSPFSQRFDTVIISPSMGISIDQKR